MKTTCTKTLVIALVIAGFALAGPAHASTISYTVGGWGPTYYPGNAVPYGAPHSPKSEGGDGYGYPGDAVGLTGFSLGTLDLLPGTHTYTNKQINTLTWAVNYTYNGTDNIWTNDSWLPRSTYWPELQFVVDTSRAISFGGGGGTLSQTGRLRTNWDWDYLLLNAGSTQTFSVVNAGEIYRIDVTPKALGEVQMNNWSGNPPWNQAQRNVLADFVVTDLGAAPTGAPVPEPASVLVWGLLGLVGAGFGLLRRKRAA